MAAAPDLTQMRRTDWLRYAWAFAVEPVDFLGREQHQVTAAGHGLGTFETAEQARAWIARRRACCLAELIAEHRVLHPPLVTVQAGGQAAGPHSPRAVGRLRRH